MPASSVTDEQRTCKEKDTGAEGLRPYRGSGDSRLCAVSRRHAATAWAQRPERAG